jgi:hypothetical protein
LGVDDTDPASVSSTGPHVAVIAIGHTGAILRDLSSIFQATGLTTKQASTLKNTLNKLAVTRLHDIYNVKNMLDKKLQGAHSS